MASDSTSRLVRLTAIQIMLQANQRPTARTIARKFGVSMRTVYRDIRALEQAGLPIHAEEGQGYALVDGYTLPPVAFSESEANALITAERLVVRNKDASFVLDYQAAMTKVRAVLRANTREKAELLTQRVVFRDNPGKERTSNHLSTLQGTITHRTLVEIKYTALADQSVSHRAIEPLALYSTQENWILVAWCRLRDDYRSFRLDCIRKLRPLSESFSDRNFDLAQYFEDCRKEWLPPDTGLSPVPTTFGISHQTPVKMEQITIEPFTVVGISVRTTNENGQAAKDIEALFNRFMSENSAAQIPNKVDEAIYSVYTDYEGNHTQPYTVVLGCRVSDDSNVPNGMIAKHCSGGTYQPFVAQGDLTEGVVYQTWASIWNSDIDRAYTADFEIYGEKARNPQAAEVDIYIAVKEA